MLAMKAKNREAALSHEDFFYELKINGERCLGDRGILYNRNGQVITRQFPEVAEAVAAGPLSRVYFDAEIACYKNGKPDPHVTAGRALLINSFDIAQRAQQSPATLHAFDLLETENGVNICKLPLSERRNQLQQMGVEDNKTVFILPANRGQGTELFEAVKNAEWEGVMCKDPTKPYWPGRRTDFWLKVKVRVTQEFFACGITVGENRQIGALILGEPQNGNLKYVGRVASGFTDKELASICEQPELAIDLLGWTGDKQVLKWIKPMPVMVEYLERSERGHLVNPRKGKNDRIRQPL